MQVRKTERAVFLVRQTLKDGSYYRMPYNTKELKNLDPFIHLDLFEVSKPAGFEAHPHRGYDTVTYYFKGTAVYEDFFGNSGQMEAGDLEWLTTGQGMLHAKFPVSEEPLEGIQLWVNLPRKDKMVKPEYQEARGPEIPKISQGGVTVMVLSGEALGRKSKIYSRTPTLFLDFTLQPGAMHVQPVPSGWTTLICNVSGTVHVGPDQEQQEVEPYHLVVFGDGDCVKFENKDLIAGSQGSEISHFLLIAGEPIKEPVVMVGNFVESTEEDVRQSISDFQNGRNGFEGAVTWKAKIDTNC